MDKTTLKNIAQELIELLKVKELPIWQCEEVLLYAKESLKNIVLK